MQREHEEAMRADYTEHDALGRQMFADGVTDADIDRIDTQRVEIEKRWHSGPHAEHWAYLSDAHEDWRQAPKTMQRMLADADHNGPGYGLTDIERRSQEQARALTGHDRLARSQIARER
ncbi:hypothetical protein [Nocardia sp. bgisy118]|uniref:hypothetical protein n=1 Tax=Nocardia sp. bgisy118 TaxID=3413786 RepID=UPI003F4A272F